MFFFFFFFFFQAEDGIRDFHVTGVQTCALPIYVRARRAAARETGRGEIGQVIGGAAGKSAGGMGRTAAAQDLDAIVPLPPHEAPAWPWPISAERQSRDDGDLAAVLAHQILGELGEQLAGGAEVRPVGPVEEPDPHALRCWRYHSMVRSSPSRKPVLARKPKRSQARVVSRHRRGWPLGLLGSHTRRPVKPVSSAMRLARSLMEISTPVPRLTGSGPSKCSAAIAIASAQSSA